MGKTKTFVACVTGQYSCDRLIRASKAISDNQKAKLTVVSVVNSADAGSDKYPEQMNALDYLNSVCRELDVEFTVLYSENCVLTAAKYIKDKRASQVFTGVPDRNSSSFINLIASVLPKVEVTVLAQESQLAPKKYSARLTPSVGTQGI